jgi:pimeloyl-ACP methyl ester carboxylesterase
MRHALILFFTLLIVWPAWAENTSLKFAQDLVQYLGIEVSEKDVAMLAEAKTKAESPELTVDQRKQAYKELFELSVRLQKSKPPSGIIDMLVSSAISWTCSGTPVIASGSAKQAELGNVIKDGNGPIPVILIPDVGMDANVFQPFLSRNKNRYTMYAVTLPGFGGTSKIPGFEKRDYSAKRLWKNAEGAIVNLIKKEKLEAPVIIGHQGGSYLAMRLALDYPEKIRGAVVLNGLLYAPMPNAKDPTGKLTLELRDQIAKVFLPIELFPRPSSECFAKYWQNIGGTMSTDPKRNLELAQNGGKSDAHLTWDYGAELYTTDLSNEISNLKIPILVIPAVTDPKKTSPNPAVDQWKSAQANNVKVIPMENVGTFPVDDNPELFDKLILDFVSTGKTAKN